MMQFHRKKMYALDLIPMPSHGSWMAELSQKKVLLILYLCPAMAHEWSNCRREKVRVRSNTYVSRMMKFHRKKKYALDLIPMPSHSSWMAELSQRKSKSAIQYLRLAMAHEWWNFTEKKTMLLILYLCAHEWPNSRRKKVRVRSNTYV